MLKKKKEKEKIIPTVSLKINKEECLLIIRALLKCKEVAEEYKSYKKSEEIQKLLNKIKNA